jgi:hypothetical protein
MSQNDTRRQPWKLHFGDDGAVESRVDREGEDLVVIRSGGGKRRGRREIENCGKEGEKDEEEDEDGDEDDGFRVQGSSLAG